MEKHTSWNYTDLHYTDKHTAYYIIRMDGFLEQGNFNFYNLFRISGG